MVLVPGEAVIGLLGNGEQWGKGFWEDGEGNRCLHQAIRECQVVLGDAFVIQQVAQAEGWGPWWNDRADTTFDDLRQKVLVEHREILPGQMQEVFGLSWHVVLGVVRRVASLDGDEMRRLIVRRMNASPTPILRTAPRRASSAASEAARWAFSSCFPKQVAPSSIQAMNCLAATAYEAAAAASELHRLFDEQDRATHRHRLLYATKALAPWKAALGKNAFVLPDRAFAWTGDDFSLPDEWSSTLAES